MNSRFERRLRPDHASVKDRAPSARLLWCWHNLGQSKCEIYICRRLTFFTSRLDTLQLTTPVHSIALRVLQPASSDLPAFTYCPCVSVSVALCSAFFTQEIDSLQLCPFDFAFALAAGEAPFAGTFLIRCSTDEAKGCRNHCIHQQFNKRFQFRILRHGPLPVTASFMDRQ